MTDYIERMMATDKTRCGVEALDLDKFLRGLRYENELRFLSDWEFRKYRNVGVLASYERHNEGDVHVDYYWGLSTCRLFPAGYPKDGIGADGRAIWESCFCITFLTERSTGRGRAKRIVLPTFANEATIRCFVKSQMRATGDNQRRVRDGLCSESQLEALEAILRRFEATGDEEGIEFAATVPCELVVQNG